MASIQTGIQLNDGFTSVLNSIIGSVSLAVSAMESMRGAMNADIDTSSLEGVRMEINQATMAVNQLEQAMSGVAAPTVSPQVDMPEISRGIKVDVVPVVPEPLIPEQAREAVTVPAEVTVESGQRIAGITSRLEGISRMQQAISDTAKHMYVLPDKAAAEISGISREIARMEQALKFLEENPFNLDSSVAELQIESISAGLDELAAKQQKIDGSLGNIPSQIIHADIDVPDPLIEDPAPVRVPLEWQTDSLDVFTGSGMERFRQEVQSTDAMLQQLCSTQDAIAKQAYNTSIFPPDAFRDLNSMAVRIDSIRDRIQQIESNPMNIGADAVNSELEQTRAQLNQIVSIQNELKAAVDGMDVSAANDAYLRLSQTVSGTERYLRDNVDEQGRFNREIDRGTDKAGGLVRTIMGAVAAYATLQTVTNVLSISDEMVQTSSRLEMMNDGLQSTQDLMNMVYLSAQSARGSFSEMAAVVARFGNNAGDAFGSSAEVVAFAELVQKQMTVAGASTAESSAAMLQLSQALGSGVLRGDELNSIFEQAPNLIQNIADYLGVGIGEIREMASEGELTADVVKSAIFDAAKEIDETFASMQMTWGQTFQSFQNTALMAFQPILTRINKLASSTAFQEFAVKATEALTVAAAIVAQIFDLMGAGAQLAADNWSWLGPIIYGVVAALAVYYGWQLAANAVSLISKGIHFAMAVAQMIHAAATGTLTVATAAEIAAQNGLNASMYACPIVWIVILIIALVAAFYAAIAAINKFAGTSISATGLIAGYFAVCVAHFLNGFIRIQNMAASFANFLGNFINDPIAAIKILFYDMCLTIIGYILNMASAIENVINKIPGVTVDITSGLDGFYSEMEEAQQAVKDESGWIEYVKKLDYIDYGDAWDAGYSFGEGIDESIANFDPASFFGVDDIPSPDDYIKEFGGGIDDISDDTGAIRDALDVTHEDLKYLRDIAEQEAVNRYTLAEVKVEQTNHNNISSTMDLDGVVSGLTDAVNEAIDSITEGVHE